MSKAILEFNLPEENEEFELAKNGARLSYAIDDFDNWLRSELKYNDKLTEAEYNVYELVRSNLHEHLSNE